MNCTSMCARGLFLASLLFGSTVYAGPIILAGTDADDHGSATATVNEDGWFFMQRALENIAGGVTTGVKKVTVLGSTSSALAAATSAFQKSLLPGAGWTFETVSTANFATFFGAGGTLNTGILMMDSGNNTGGGVNGSAFVPHANAINTFLGAGGGLFSQANGYQWLSTLLPGLLAQGESNTGLALTAAGSAAFPGLTNADLSAGPYHNRFANFGNLTVLANSTSTGNPIIIGTFAGSITNPEPPPTSVPEPASIALLLLGIAGVAATRKRRA